MRADATRKHAYMQHEFQIGRDQRLADNPRLLEACKGASTLLPVYDLDSAIPMGPHRIAFLLDSLRALQQQLRALGSDLLLRLQAPDEMYREYYDGAPTMYDANDLPFDLPALPDVFTSFRRLVEKHATPIRKPLDAPLSLPPLPTGVVCADIPSPDQLGYEIMECDARSAFPYNNEAWRAGEHSARAHLRRYLASRTIDTYKTTRNGLIGTGFSSKLSPWLALGNISARSVAWAIRDYEQQYGANDGTYWLWFELVWRDYFSLRGRTYGLSQPATIVDVDKDNFRAWITASTGCAFVDAGMQELRSTGWLSNRMRQIVASYLIHELQAPWQWGEEWFAMQLIDYDPASNEGNWRYIAGQGADPRGGRHFSIEHQRLMYDPEDVYAHHWK